MRQNSKNIIETIFRKLRQRGYEDIICFRTRIGYIIAGSRDSESCVVYLVERREDNILNVINNVVNFLKIENIYEAEPSTFDIYLRRVRPRFERSAEIIERCRKYMRILSSIGEGQWFDHMRYREKMRGRATVELIRVIKVLEELEAVEPVWRRWGHGQQHTLRIRRRLSKGELLYYLLKLLNIGISIER